MSIFYKLSLQTLNFFYNQYDDKHIDNFIALNVKPREINLSTCFG